MSLVPRWRTRTAPASTTLPAYSFTPSRCPAESRPLRVEPAPFLCAIPYASIFVIFTVVVFERCPVRFRERVLFLYRKTTIFSPLPWPTISPVTFAVAASFTASPSARSRTSPKVTSFPGSPSRLATVRIAPSSTRYCLPPLRTTAYTGRPPIQEKSPRPPDATYEKYTGWALEWGSAGAGEAGPGRTTSGGRHDHLRRPASRAKTHRERDDPEDRGETHDRRGVRD